ncbi:MAG: flagellar basal body-associated FliL family protein [Rhodospirillales bacterium]|nr:flagellar basal body-associated FliL family protein [Rhodospirillales bacterium]
MKQRMLLSILTAFALLTWSESIYAADDDEDAPKPPTQIHLEHFVVPLADSSRKVAVTMFLKVYDQEKLWRVCRAEARVRDAINLYLYNYPFKVTKDKDLDLGRVAKKLRPRINKALKEKLVKKVLIAKGKITFDVESVKKPHIPNPGNCGMIGFRQKGKQKS